jgi:hypothetical protein
MCVVITIFIQPVEQPFTHIIVKASQLTAGSPLFIKLRTIRSVPINEARML